jgi:hypothetical protein
VGGRATDGQGRLSLCPALGQGAGDARTRGKGEQVVAPLEHFLEIAPALAPLLRYLRPHAGRMRSGPARPRGDFLGSGAAESTGKQLTAARIKGAGMRWKVTGLDALLTLRWVCLAPSWKSYWESCPHLTA